MCGISGVISLNTDKVNKVILKKMTDAIAHRGPDGEGHWVSACGKVGLGHRRLSIIDLSHEADQPMHYMGRYTIVFNGEIYNYLELKEVLLNQGYVFKTLSDTEVLMALYHREKENCLSLLDGMFSFAIFDALENKIFCARDRFGEKPFYYSYLAGSHFYFGSEMKCLWAAGIAKTLNNRMLYNYITYQLLENVENPEETFYENCYKLPHAHYVVIDCSTMQLSVKQYYYLDWKKQNDDITLENAKVKLQELFYTSVQRRLRSDVTVGSSLSGGLDSSLVVRVIDELKKGSAQQQDTFSAVFPGFKKDERKYMDYVIEKSNVNPHFVTPNNDGLFDDIQKIVHHQEEPFVSSSIYVQYCVMELAKKNNVTVLLDGQGADEILAGYHHFYPSFFNELKSNNKEKYQSQYHAYLKLHETNQINGISKGSLSDKISNISPNAIRSVKKMRLFAKQITAPFINADFYNAFKSNIYLSYGNTYPTLNETLCHSTFDGGLQTLLRYADRNSMAHSREVRLPFLSHELVDFLFTLPSHFKMNNGWTKFIMRETFTEMPPVIAWRVDKIGYEAPQQNWLTKANVKDRIHACRKKLADANILDKKYVEKAANNDNLYLNNAWCHWMVGEII
jgi:asparagine synthase (glutamine-hydrolysing)